MVPLIVQHAALAIVPVIIGAWLNRKLGVIEVHVNGKMSRMEKRLAKLESAESRQDDDAGDVSV